MITGVLFVTVVLLALLLAVFALTAVSSGFVTS